MLKTINVLIRLLGAVHLTIATAYDILRSNPAEPSPLDDKMGGKAKYLTIWANVALIVYFWLSLINDFKDEKNQFLVKLNDYVFLSIAFPSTTVVSLMFWGLYAVDQDLIFPKKGGQTQTPPIWLNHSLHTAVLLYAVLELFTSYHRPTSKKSHLIGVTAIFAAYSVWLHIVYFMTGFWIYPILNRLNWFGREILTAFAGLMGYGAFFLGLCANNIIWKRKVEKFEVSSAP